jgi:protein tyrosine phosphatase
MFPQTVAVLPENAPKNRYGNVLPFDHTRVVLPQSGRDGCGDYINANYVAGAGGKRAYVCCQGPLPGTVSDFWRMVWEENSRVIVMATRENEGGRLKCDRYWPAMHEKMEAGSFVVTALGEEDCGAFVIRRFAVTPGEQMDGQQPREVVQYHFVAWPDFGVPASAAPVLDLLGRIRVQQTTAPLPGPAVVHCSAGIGRTGTLLAIDICLDRLRNDGVADIDGTVLELRHQRPGMVQTADQYAFVYQVGLDPVALYVLFGG